MSSINKALAEAMECIAAEQFATAFTLCEQILNEQPEHEDAGNLLFVIAYQSDDADGALDLLARALDSHPDSARLHLNHGLLLRLLRRHGESVESFQRAIAISPDCVEARLGLIEVLEEMGQDPGILGGLLLQGNVRFLKLGTHAGGMVLTGISVDEKHFIKIEVVHHPKKGNSLEEEAKIMGHLNERKCVTCPQMHEYGTLAISELVPFLDPEQKAIVEATGKDALPYILQEFVPTGENLYLADMILSLIEQKNLGIYHADLRPENMRIDDEKGICYFIDYDQAVFLSHEVTSLDNIAFLDWCNEWAKKKYRVASFLHFFPTLTMEQDFLPHFREGSFNLGLTTIFQRQQTTLAACGIYHTLSEDAIFADGERNITDRRHRLDAVEIVPGERILDVGCNTGLVSTYFHDRGCKVTGIDIDRSVIYGARIVANILHKDIRFECVDLDAGEIVDEFDTITLFSVLHHTRNVVENAAKIAGKCQRVLIECRLKEIGAKPEDGVWRNTSAWDYESVDDLVVGLERIFPGFALMKNYGKGDRDRYLLEFAKP